VQLIKHKVVIEVNENKSHWSSLEVVALWAKLIAQMLCALT
jgi:hypothetical protein